MNVRSPRMRALHAAAFGALLIAPLVAWADDAPTIDEVEAARQRVVAKCVPAVCAIASGGSGVIIDPAGYALTNFHVSNTNPNQKVGLPDGKVYDAKLLGIDATGDIALIKLQGDGPFPFVELGSSDAMRPGDLVYAMGNPFVLAADYQPTVTEGVVSGIHRFKQGAGPTDLVYGDCIQIDAAINPGNSGGPLFDIQGRLIGINGLGGFRQDRGRVFVGVGYAASIDQIKNFLSDLYACLLCEHGTMDATVADRTDPDDPQRTRVVVDALFKDSPAYEAGLRLGDVILELDGEPIATQNGFLTRLQRLPANRRVHLLSARRDRDGVWTRQRVSFRLAGLPSSVKPGAFRRDPDLVLAELQTRLLKLRSWLGVTAEDQMRPAAPVRMTGTRVFHAHDADADGEPDAAPRAPDAVELRRHGPRLVMRSSAGGLAGFDGSSAWSRTGDEPGPTALADEAETLAAAEAMFDALLTSNPEDHFAGLDFTGGELVGGRRCDRIEAVSNEGVRVAYLLDPGDGALRGYRYSSPAREDREVVVIFEEFRLARGRQRPHRITIEVDGFRESTIGAIRWDSVDPLAEAGALRDAAAAFPAIGAPDEAVIARVAATPAPAGPAPIAAPVGPGFADTVAKVYPSVVKIYGAGGFRGIPGNGTGVITSADGTIVTAWSVMLDTDRLKVVTADGRRLSAKLERRDTELGLALLKVEEAEGLRPLPLAHRATVEAGDLVLAIGNAFNDAVGAEPPAVGHGVVMAVAPIDLRVSGRARRAVEGAALPVIIVDAEGNPGTQGGPLLDREGRWIGINGRVVENRDSNEETSWAVPAAHIRAFLAGRSVRPRPARGGDEVPRGGWLGVRLLDLSLDRSPPAYVDRVPKGTPAAKAGLRPDDLIFQLDHETVSSCRALDELLAARTAGDTITLHVKRGRVVVSLEVTLGEPPAPPPVRPGEAEEPPGDEKPGEDEKKKPDEGGDDHGDHDGHDHGDGGGR